MSELENLSDEELAALADAAVVTLAQTALAVDEAYERGGYATRHFGQLILGVLAQSADVFGGDERASMAMDLVVRQLSLDPTAQQWQMYARMPVDIERIEILGTALFNAAFLAPEEVERRCDVLVSPVFGYSPFDSLPPTIFLNSRFVALALVSIEQATRNRGALERDACLNLTAAFLAQMLVMWRLMEKAALITGRDLGYEVRL